MKNISWQAVSTVLSLNDNNRKVGFYFFVTPNTHNISGDMPI